MADRKSIWSNDIASSENERFIVEWPKLKKEKSNISFYLENRNSTKISEVNGTRAR